MQQNNYQPTHNLDLLRILYIVKACFNFLGVLGFIAYAVFGAFISSFIGNVPDSEPFPMQLSWIFVIIGAVGALIFLVMAILTLVAAKKIKNRQSHTFILVVGIINCISGMLGIALGVFTLVELTKPHVKALFQPQTQTKVGF
jgi:ABC-type Fe3+ transport system permease subunit